MRFLKKPGGSRSGFTLLEMAIVLGLICAILGTLAAVYPALTEATVDTELFLMAQMENDRARMAINEDLQTTDSTGKDAAGVPYFAIVDHGGGTANSVTFRKAEGFDIDVAEDLVKARFGTPVQYYVDPSGSLVRSQDGLTRTVASRVSRIHFSVTIQGAITAHVVTSFGKDGERTEVTSEWEITPRNVIRL